MILLSYEEMARLTITTESEKETKKIAEEFAKLLKLRKNGALVLALSGELGAGKTRFVQGLARGLGISKNITSPTFVISKEYRLRSKKTPFHFFYHLDFYRLSTREDLLGVDFEDTLSKPVALVAIEWAERIKSAIPKDAIWIRFKRVDEEKRKLVISK